MTDIKPKADYDSLPLVSIVTPSLNQGRFIRQTITTVLGQDYPRLEYWVVDGGSTDETLAILGEFETDSRFHWLSEPDQGQAHAIAKGWQRSRGEIIAWLNSDDSYRPGAIRTAVKALLNHPQAALVCGGAVIVNEMGQQTGQITSPRLDLEQMLQMRAFLPQPAVFLRAAAVNHIGGINPQLQYAMDFDLFLRLAATAELIYIEDYLADYRLHYVSKTSSNFYRLRQEAAQVAQSFLKNCGSHGFAQKKQYLSYAYLVEAYADFRLGRPGDLVKKSAKGLKMYPANTQWVFRRILKHLLETFK